MDIGRRPCENRPGGVDGGRRLEGRLDLAARSETGDVPGIELAQVAAGALGAHVLARRSP